MNEKVSNFEENDEEDYMAMDLTELENSVKVETEKHLSYSKRRKLAEQERKTKSSKPLEKSEKEKLQDSLNTHLPESNLGFQLLKKMGFKKDEGLGKGEKKPIQEPIKFNLDSGRIGIGLKTKQKEQVELMKLVKSKAEMITAKHFKNHSKTKFQLKDIKDDWYKSKAVCEQLDRKQGVTDNPLWLPYSQETKYNDARKNKENDPDYLRIVNEDLGFDVDFESELENLTTYLRNKYYYCIWCGEAYEDEEDLDEHCPGPERELH